MRFKYFLMACFVFSTLLLSSQQINTLYFMENVPVRNSLNPAFQPLSNFYFGIPALGYSQFSFGNNSITLNDIVYNDVNGNPITFLHKNGNKKSFYDVLKTTTSFNTELQIDLVEFGFRTDKSYWNFSLKERVEGQVGVPSELLKFLLFGTPEMDDNYFDFNLLGFRATAYTEAGLGYSRVINDKWTVGTKLKFLYGNANTKAVNESFNLSAGIDEWNLKGNGTIRYASTVELNGTNFKTLDPSFSSSVLDYVKPSGLGAGFDLGFTYKPIKNLTLSAALTDLGMIRWNNNLKTFGYDMDYNFTGLDSLNIYSNTDLNEIADSIYDLVKDSFRDSLEVSSNPYTTYTSPKINAGVEYAFYDNKLSLGLLSKTTFQNKNIYQEFTASINGRPVNWFNMSLSYSIMNGAMSNIGAGIGLRTGFMHWFVSADYIPLYYIPVQLNEIDSDFPTFNALIPSQTKRFNVAFGVNLVFGNKKDADKDGVSDKKDKCPDTPLNVKVDENGCPIDSDDDGVPDYLDKCANTPQAAFNKLDKYGCPLDSDADGVPDYLDNCPATPLEAKGFVDAHGCELDTDMDGVSDYLDKCPDSAYGMVVDSVGCPLDTLGVLIPDSLDKNKIVKRDSIITDTISNGADKVKVISPADKIVKVDLEQHPELKSLFHKALQGVQFAMGSSSILDRSHKILNQILGVLIANPDYLIEINGYTDNTGNAKFNLMLSKNRALAIRKYLIKNGVAENRIMTNGYGETLPMASNKTAFGRYLNRRVEFVAWYKEITFE